MTKFLVRLIFGLALFYGAYAIAERAIVYPLDPREIAPGVPGMSASRFEQDGYSLVVWSAAAAAGRPTILYLHGNAGHLEMRQRRFQRLMDRGYGIVAPGLVGGSGSKGWPTEAKIRESLALLYMSFDQSLVLYGESIGAAAAIALNNDLPSDKRPLAVVLEAPFTKLKDVAAHLHPLLPLSMGLMLSRWSSIDRAPSLEAPLLVLHGTEDQLIPLIQGQSIYNAARSVDKTFVAVDGASHVNVWKAQAQRELYEFLRKLKP